MLSDRLKCVADMVSQNACIADIGTDHCKLVIYLLQTEKISKAIACDINSGPLISAKKNLQKYRFLDNVELRLSDGLAKLSLGEVSAIVIAGMGGELIADILAKGDCVARSCKEIILQPMTCVPQLRRFLAENNYETIDEVLAKEGEKFYNIIKAVPQKCAPKSDYQYIIPDILIKRGGEHLKKYILLEINKLDVQIKGLESAVNIDNTKIQSCKDVRKYLRGLL